MHRLTYLRLSGRGEIGPRPPKSASIWPGVYKTRDIASRYAQLMKTKCPSLRYVCIERRAWEITRESNPAGSTGTDDLSGIELRELEYSERIAIPLFAIAHLESQSGLPMTELEFLYEASSVERHNMRVSKERMIEEGMSMTDGRFQNHLIDRGEEGWWVGTDDEEEDTSEESDDSDDEEDFRG
jgi:hypothetical protein